MAQRKDLLNVILLLIVDSRIDNSLKEPDMNTKRVNKYIYE